MRDTDHVNKDFRIGNLGRVCGTVERITEHDIAPVWQLAFGAWPNQGECYVLAPEGA